MVWMGKAQCDNEYYHNVKFDSYCIYSVRKSHYSFCHMTWCQNVTIKTRQRGWKMKMRLTWTEVLFFDTHICTVNTAKYKDSSSYGFGDTSCQTYPVSALQTRMHCYLIIAAAFHKLDYYSIREKEQLCFKKRTTLFCQTEISKLLAFCSNVNILHACHIVHFSQCTEMIDIPSN